MSFIGKVMNLIDHEETGLAFGIGFVTGYIYSMIGFFDLLVLMGIGVAACNKNKIIEQYNKFKAEGRFDLGYN